MARHHVVVGSGINALVAAALLARKGERVTVLEREERVGGCLRTEEATIPGFRHDVMAATWVLFATGPAMGALGPDLARHGFILRNGPHPTGVLRPDGTALVLTTDREANARALDARAPGDGAAWRAAVGGVERDAPFLFALLGGPVWGMRTFGLLLNEARKRGPRGLLQWFGEALAPARGWLEGAFEGEDARALLAPWVLHCGLTPESTYSGKMAQVVAFALEAAGAPVVEGGSGAAAEAFRRLIEEKGGTVRTGAEVDRVLVERGRVAGVELTGGERVAADSVLASVSAGALWGRRLRDADAPGDKAAAARVRRGRGDFQLNFALDGQPDWIGEGVADVALLHLTDGLDAVSRSCNEATRGLLPAVPTICVGQPHALDPSRCPPGKAVLWLQIPDAPRRPEGDAAGEIACDGTWSEAVREAFADRLEGILRGHVRNWDAIRLARRAYSPADLAHLNVNLVEGDPYGGDCALDQFFAFRPFARAADGRTGVRGLRLIGAATHPGPGLSGGSGFMAAKGLGA